MPLKKVRKNATAATRQKVVSGNIAILTNAQADKPKKNRMPTKQILAVALSVAYPNKHKKSKK